MAVSVLDAFRLIKANVKALGTEIIKIEDASNRISATKIKATYPLPRFNNSAMDGYAVKLTDANRAVNIKEVIYAGDYPQNELKENTHLLNKYPKSAGEDCLKDAMINFVQKRFQCNLTYSQIIPTFGTREVLFNFPQYLLTHKENTCMAFTNPFYQIYEGSAIATNSKVIYINLTKQNDFKAKLLSDEEFKQCDLVILNFPNNPTGATLNFIGFQYWIELSQKYDFVLLNDDKTK